MSGRRNSMARLCLVLFVLFSFVAGFDVAVAGEAATGKGVLSPLPLVSSFLHKLEENTPFDKESDELYFGSKFGMLTGYVLYDALGYMKEDSHAFKTVPGKSALGELIRLSRKEIIIERSNQKKRKNIIDIILFEASTAHVVSSTLGFHPRVLPKTPTPEKNISELTTLVTVMIGDGEREILLNPVRVINFFLFKNDATGKYYICPDNTYVNGRRLLDILDFVKVKNGKPVGVKKDGIPKLKALLEQDDNKISKSKKNGN